MYKIVRELKATIFEDQHLSNAQTVSQNLSSYSGVGTVERPNKWLFEGQDGACLSQRGTQWVVSEAVKKAGIIKEVSTHTLRHSYATHLLEQGLDIVTIKDLLGHAAIETTMVYLHIARAQCQNGLQPTGQTLQQALMQPAFEVAGVLQAHWLQLQHSGPYNSWQMRTMDAIRRCRTASMGAHVDGCMECGHLRISYNSCRNRHCPKCQGREREKWIQAREEELLPVPYFHVVFTLPDLLGRLCLFKPKILYDLLFTTAWSVMNSFGHDPKFLGAQTGMISILHTWGQTMSLHPHLHCIVPGGGLTKQGRWKEAKSDGKYLFSVRAMSKVFRGRFMAALKEELPDQLDKSLISRLYKYNWVVYAKRPFADPRSVVEYLGRYTHKIAISNHRITDHTNGQVTFSYKDYKHGSVKKEMTLDAGEFIRRFSLHILPKGFVRIRHFGILSSSAKDKALPLIREQVPDQQVSLDGNKTKAKPEAYNPKQCPYCKKETMETVMHFSRRGPPSDWKEQAMQLLEMIKTGT